MSEFCNLAGLITWTKNAQKFFHGQNTTARGSIGGSRYFSGLLDVLQGVSLGSFGSWLGSIGGPLVVQ